MRVGIDDGFEAFRGRYPSAREAVAECENALWVVRIAFDAAKDKKSILRMAAQAAADSNPWWIGFEFIVPLHDPRDVLDRWTGYRTEEDEPDQGVVANNIDAALLPVVAGWALWILIATARLWTSLASHRTLIASVIAVGVMVGGFLLMKRWSRWLFRRQLARFNADAGTALALVLRWMKADPGRMERRLWTLRHDCLELLDREAALA